MADLVFMCKTDFEHELGAAMGGVTVYPSEKDARENRSCIDECGLVEVEVMLKRVVQEDDFSKYFSSAKDAE